MPNWNREYVASLKTEFGDITQNLPERLDEITNGRVIPETEDLSIGTGRKLRGAVFFFDIREFTNRTGSPDDDSLKQTLYMLNSVISMVMKLVHDHGGYIEKNTGDGVMAIFGAEAAVSDKEAAKSALEVAMGSFYLLEHIINPHLAEKGIAPVHVRIGIDLGPLLFARVGVPKGTAAQDRSFLTAVGPAANLACKFQDMAGTDEIWVGDLIKKNAPAEWLGYFTEKTPLGWTWIYVGSGNIYPVWYFHAGRPHPVA